MLQLDLYLLNLFAAKNNKLTTCKYLTSNFEDVISGQTVIVQCTI
jgi:hypothetical protein